MTGRTAPYGPSPAESTSKGSNLARSASHSRLTPGMAESLSTQVSKAPELSNLQAARVRDAR